jgi:hypothetical protein
LPAGELLRAFVDGLPIPSKHLLCQSLATAPERVNDFSHESPPIAPLEDRGSMFPYRQNLYIAFLCDSATAKF